MSCYIVLDNLSDEVDRPQKLRRNAHPEDEHPGYYTTVPMWWKSECPPFDRISPACKDLAVVPSGTCTGDGTHPVLVTRLASSNYTGLLDDQLASLSKALGG